MSGAGPSQRPGVAARFAAVLVAAAALASAGCATPVRTEHDGAETVYGDVHVSALTGDEPSVAARLVIERAGLWETWEDDGAVALVALHHAAESGDTRDRLYGLAELSLVQGKRSGERRWFLGSAVYAYLYLFGKAEAPPPGAFDPRFRRACDIYERALAEAFRDEDSGEFRPEGGTMPLPVGSIVVTAPPPVLHVGDATFDEFRIADEYSVKGMRSRVRVEGLGVPLVAGRRLRPEDAGTKLVVGRLPARIRVAGTAVLDVVGEFAGLGRGAARATLSLRSLYEGRSVSIRGAEVPLTIDVTAPLAYGLTESKLWSHEMFGFLSTSSDFDNGLVLAQPYQRGKIPLVFVHGTASSPARWAEMLNELAADPVIANAYQPWLFIYSTGAPILVSADSLRKSLAETIAAIDPRGEDAALSRMVVMGHSQGGLLTRLMVTSSGDRFWHNLSDAPIDSLDLQPDERKLLTETLFFEPVPQIERVIFVSTPHKGSYVAGNFFGRIGSMLVSLPKKLTTNLHDVVSRNMAKIQGDKLGSLPTAVDNMAPGSVFCQALGDLPISPRVRVNSIVAVDGDGPPEDGDDGVVAYESAHFPSAESELVVRSPHSAQGNPRTIIEVRRILRLHVGQK